MVARLQHDDMHGIPMTEEAFEHLISVESPYRYELIDGIVYDMMGSTPEHGTIAGNIFSLLHAQISSQKPCRYAKVATMAYILISARIMAKRSIYDLRATIPIDNSTD